ACGALGPPDRYGDLLSDPAPPPDLFRGARACRGGLPPRRGGCARDPGPADVSGALRGSAVLGRDRDRPVLRGAVEEPGQQRTGPPDRPPAGRSASVLPGVLGPAADAAAEGRRPKPLRRSPCRRLVAPPLRRLVAPPRCQLASPDFEVLGLVIERDVELAGHLA